MVLGEREATSAVDGAQHRGAEPRSTDRFARTGPEPGQGGESPPSRTADRAQARSDQVWAGDSEIESPAPDPVVRRIPGVDSAGETRSGTDQLVSDPTADVPTHQRQWFTAFPGPHAGDVGQEPSDTDQSISDSAADVSAHSLEQHDAECAATNPPGTDQLVPATVPQTNSVHHVRRLASRLGSLTAGLGD
jgi:hypothetical protein